MVDCLVLAASMVTIHPQVYTNAFANPLKGFRYDFVTKRDAGYAGYAPDDTRHPFVYVRLMRHYIRWNDIENCEADGIEKIKAFCDLNWKGFAEHNVKVIPRVYLDWMRNPGDEYWPSDIEAGDYTSEKFKARVKRLIARLGECWDNDPRVAWVQMGIIGAWGEHHSPHPTEEMQDLLGTAFQSAFKNKKVLVRYAFQFKNFKFGYIDDSWGWDFLMSNSAVKLMSDKIVKENRYFDQVIEGEFALGETYRKNKGVYPGYTVKEILGLPDHVKWVTDSIRTLHASALGCIDMYANEPDCYPGAAEVQKAFGYTFVLPEVSWTPSVSAMGKLRVKFKVLNVGSAPFYYQWPVYAVLLNAETHRPLWAGKFKTDIREWMPGANWNKKAERYMKPPKENVVDGTFDLPDKLKGGRYVLALCVIDPGGKKPSLRFATVNYFRGGWHPIGYVSYESASGDPLLTGVEFDDLATDFTLGYAK